MVRCSLYSLENEIVSRTHMNMTADLKNQLAAAKREFAKATKEYECGAFELSERRCTGTKICI